MKIDKYISIQNSKLYFYILYSIHVRIIYPYNIIENIENNLEKIQDKNIEEVYEILRVLSYFSVDLRRHIFELTLLSEFRDFYKFVYKTSVYRKYWVPQEIRTIL